MTWTIFQYRISKRGLLTNMLKNFVGQRKFEKKSSSRILVEGIKDQDYWK